MKIYLIVAMLAVLGSTVLLSSFVATSAFAQDTPYSEGYMQQHDGGDRAEYLQELEEEDDPPFYVPPVNNASFPAANNASATSDMN
jgi:hypothetical protein